MEISRTALGTPYREDDRIVLLAQFISEYYTSPNIEIEVKIGTFFLNSSTQQISHISEINMQNIPGRFESSLQPLMFFSLLELLKITCPNFIFFETEDSLYTCSDRNSKIRQTIGQNNEIIAIIKKTRIADKNFLINSHGSGIRISANIEEGIDKIPEESKFYVLRKKKRYSFRHLYLVIDLTEVSMNNKVFYEAEIEIVDFPFVKTHANNFLLGLDKGGLIGIARKIWQNSLALSYHKPKAMVVRVSENLELMEDRERVYKKFIGSDFPLIGDYLFCIAKELENVEP
ncbi:hypothetical protein SteCoe_21542 [Stentor coeruleus]|uniref:mRNA 5'-phosphatase n=1 Tax=Stentor coeruleus TaxID=5963 RepID=A0A1R2BPF2_9CILI|nr:hypothetical protein SteCoe_21542 [Stentor coeruleus]